MTPLLGPRVATALAALSGLAMAGAFAPVAVGPLAIVAVSLLTASLWGASVRRGLGLGLVSGLVFFPVLLWWMRAVGTDAWLLLSVFCALWFALLGAGTALVTRLPAVPVWIGSLWVLEEAVRGRIPLGGFPWGSIAFSMADTTLLSYASWGGAPLVTFVAAAVGAAIVVGLLAARAGRARPATAWLAGSLVLLVAPALLARPTSGDAVGGAPSTTIALVQGGTPQIGLGAFDVRRAVLDNHVAQTLDLAAAVDAGEVPAPSFVLWPENSSDLDPFADPSVADAITSAARAVGAPILIGAVIAAPDDPTGAWNVGVVWDPQTGPGRMYIKNHPVPFGEYLPFRAQLADLVGRFDRIPRDFLPGTEPGNLTIAGVSVGDVICFEVAYAEAVDGVVDGGARLITVQTNNATYGGTAQPAQQLAIERVRASEFGRTVVVAATSGISAVIAPDSSLVAEMGEDQAGWVVQDVALRGTLTWASRIGHLVEALIALSGVGALVAAIVVRTRTARSGRSRRVAR